MKEIFGALGSEILRPLATLVLPGAVAISPYYLLLRTCFPRFASLTAANPAESILVFVAAALFMGFILEDMGSDLESRWDAIGAWDRKAGKTCIQSDQVTADWYAYLRQALAVEPIGHRYVRTLVLRMKFELGAFMGLWLALPGIVGLFVRHYWVVGFGTREWTLAGTSAAVFAITLWYLKREARDGHCLLCQLRAQMLRLSEAAKPKEQAPAAPPRDDARAVLTAMQGPSPLNADHPAPPAE